MRLLGNQARRKRVPGFFMSYCEKKYTDKTLRRVMIAGIFVLSN